MFDILYHEAPSGVVGIGPLTRGDLSVLDQGNGLGAVVSNGDMQYVEPAEVSTVNIEQWTGKDVYFTPAVFSSKGLSKDHFLATRVVWCDIDNSAPPQFTLPPSIIVHSGRGWHLYWVLTEWCYDRERIESINKLLAGDSGGDKCWNVNRLLRVPGTVNYKHKEPHVCNIRKITNCIWTLGELEGLSSLLAKTRHKIRTGDRRGYRSRSERDWAVISELVEAGYTDGGIRHIFDYTPVGDKHRSSDDGYLSRTIAKRRETAGNTVVARSARGAGDIDERDDGYYIVSGKSSRRISTFVLDPRVLLVAEDQDALICDVRAGGYEWHSVSFSRAAFNSRSNLDKETRLASWMWLGKDDDIRALLPFLIRRLEDRGLPKRRATTVLGLHKHPDREEYFFVGKSLTLGADRAFLAVDAPLAYLNAGREAPDLFGSIAPTGDAVSLRSESSTLEGIRALLPNLNEPGVIWPLIGWYFATPLKPLIEQLGYRFPVLNVFGTKGSGKTTLIQRVFLPLLGNTGAKSYDANTTRFVMLSLFGSTNAVPVAFSEFRAATVDKILRYILLAYDAGHDPRGRADQTVQDYTLSAPFSVDGEDMLADPAVKERMVGVQLHPETITEGSKPWLALQSLRQLEPHFLSYATTYLSYLLTKVQSTGLQKSLETAAAEIMATWSSPLPDRVRRNLTVVWLGVRLWCEFSGLDYPPVSVLQSCLDLVYNTKTGRASTLVDEFVSDIANQARAGGFPTETQKEGQLWLQLRPAFNWWTINRRRGGSTSLGIEAVRSQLLEAPYYLGVQQIRNVVMYGIDLKKASELGLDLPTTLTRSWNG